MPITPPKSATFKVVFIPANNNLPMEVQEVPQDAENVLSAMTDFCKKHILQKEHERRQTLSESEISSEKDVITKQLEAEIKKQPAMQGIVLTDDIITRLYDSNAVDVVPLLNTTKVSEYIGVSMYVDDQGVAKKLPVNERASVLCNALHRPIQVLGDCWIARYYDDDDDFIRYDMTFDNLDEKEPWLQLAQKLNLKILQETDEFKQRQQQQQQQQVITQAPTPVGPKCASGRNGCSKPASKKCGRCKQVFYCSIPHQKEDWEFHKNNCYARKH